MGNTDLKNIFLDKAVLKLISSAEKKKIETWAFQRRPRLVVEGMTQNRKVWNVTGRETKEVWPSIRKLERKTLFLDEG